MENIIEMTMYITGVILENDIFESIYSIFNNRNDLMNWLEIIDKVNIKFDDENIKTIEIKGLIFPIIILEMFQNDKHIYKIVDKDKFNELIEKINLDVDDEKTYFNLWKVDNNIFNKVFPAESCLTGNVFHLHIQNNDIVEMKQFGIGKYMDNN